MIHLKQRTEQPDNAFPKAQEERLVLHFIGILQMNAVALVGEEDLFQPACHRLPIEEYVGFKIVLKTPQVEIGGSASGNAVVADQQLRMIESFSVELHLHAGLQRLVDERAAGPAYKL